MSRSPDWMVKKILDFMTVLYQCYINTTHAEDRAIYSKDIAMAMGWLVDLRGGGNIDEVINKILSSETDKYFGDYWRQGVWGEKEVDALKKLQDELKASSPARGKRNPGP